MSHLKSSIICDPYFLVFDGFGTFKSREVNWLQQPTRLAQGSTFVQNFPIGLCTEISNFP